MTLTELNQCPAAVAALALQRCNAAPTWIAGMVAARPFVDRAALLAAAASIWETMDENNLLEAFSAHPEIGNMTSLRAKYAATENLAAGEQSLVTSSDDAVLSALAGGNRVYREKFGFIFIVCATGKSAGEMLALLRARLPNDRPRELRNAAAEQGKITALRLAKLLTENSADGGAP